MARGEPASLIEADFSAWFSTDAEGVQGNYTQDPEGLGAAELRKAAAPRKSYQKRLSG